jgi:predicted alpha/beta-fold hydrolase
MKLLQRFWFWKILFYALGNSLLGLFKSTKEKAQVYGRGDILLLRNIRPFHPKRWLANPWMQMLVAPTLYVNLNYERTTLSINDGITLTLDILSPFQITNSPFEKLSLDAAPLLLICPGLGSNSDNDLITNICAEAQTRRWRSIVYNRRGHSNNPTQWFPQHAQLDDLKEVVSYLNVRYPYALKVMMGISCGANLAVKYIGSPDLPNPFLGAISVSNGFDIDEATRSFTPMVHQIMLEWLRGLYWQHKPALQAAHPDLNYKAIENAKNAREFEEHLVLPIYGFSTLDEYYKSQSCISHIDNVRIPLLVITARDDPIVSPERAKCAMDSANPHILTMVTNRGGHANWIESKGSSWLVHVIMTYTENLIHRTKFRTLRDSCNLSKMRARIHPYVYQLQPITNQKPNDPSETCV